MNKAVMTVNGMSCAHCVMAIERAVRALPGVASAKVDLGARTLSVEYAPSEVSLDDIRRTVVEQGYEVA
ncbi:MAG TPA: cation transporter [Bacillota bacterium]|nr:heavy-metal-associated domain-containing protein [Bacillota bacterium]HOA14699.1 cation transporter [Bacillota bacterium]HOG52795.1 cation transporter [Bacillota bacterium]